MIPFKEKIQHSPFKSVKAIARHLGINHSSVFNFIARRYHKIGRAQRKLIRQFFIEQGLLPKPKPRKPPQCKRCGLEYPTRKKRIQDNPSSNTSQP